MRGNCGTFHATERQGGGRAGEEEGVRWIEESEGLRESRAGQGSRNGGEGGEGSMVAMRKRCWAAVAADLGRRRRR